MFLKFDRDIVQNISMICKNWPQLQICKIYKPSPTILLIFSFFSNNLQNKTVGLSWIQTRIVSLEVEHTDLLPTTTA